MKRMTSLMLILGLMSAVLLSCKKERIVEFNMNLESIFIIPNGTGISVPVNTLIPKVVTNSETICKSNETDVLNIKDVSLIALDLEVKSPSGVEFDFLEDVEVYISAIGVDEVLLGYVFNMQNLVDNTVSLTCSQSNLKMFLSQDEYTLRVRTVSDELISDDVEINIKSNFLVHAKQI